MKVQIVFNGNKDELIKKLYLNKEFWGVVKEEEEGCEEFAHHQYWNFTNLIDRIESMTPNASVLRDYHSGSYCKLYFHNDKVVMFGYGARGALQQNGTIFKVMAKLAYSSDMCCIEMLKTTTPEMKIDEWYDASKDVDEELLDRVKYRLWKEDVIIKSLASIAGGFPYYTSDFKTALCGDDDCWDILTHSELNLTGMSRDTPPSQDEAKEILHRPANWGRLLYLMYKGKSFDGRPYAPADD